MIDVALVDDEALIRGGLAALIEAEADMRVVAQADDGAGIVGLVRRARPDVVLMDVRMPRMDGIEATAALLRAMDEPPKVIVVTTFEHDDYVYGALRAGASGFLLKRSTPADIVAAIRVVHAGDSLLFPAAIRSLAAAHGPADAGRASTVDRLTERELATLVLVAQGLSNAEIAEALHVTVETVKTHMSNVLGKLGARNRTQAVIAAYEAGLVVPTRSGQSATEAG